MARVPAAGRVDPVRSGATSWRLDSRWGLQACRHMLEAVIRFLIGLVFGVVLIPLAVVLCTLAWNRVPSALPEDPYALAIGLALGLGLAFVNRRPKWLWWFSHTFLHELCHALACLATGVRIRSFKVTGGNGGAVEYDQTGPIRTTLIAMAPYTLPLLPLPLLIAQHLSHDAAWRAGLSGACGWAIIAHLHGLWQNLRLNLIPADGDLAITGRLLGMVLIWVALLTLFAGSIVVLWSSQRLVAGWPI